MSGSRLGLAAAGLLGAGLLVLLALPAQAQAPAAPVPDAAGGLDLSVRARALGVAPEPYAAGGLGLETMRAPTGAGTTRLPRVETRGSGPGLYVGVVVCDPVWGSRGYAIRADDAGSLPEGPLRGAPGSRPDLLPLLRPAP